MRFLGHLLLAVSFAAAKPIDPLVAVHRSQRVLQSQQASSNRPPSHRTPRFDAAPNSVGLLLTSSGEQLEEVMHVWLPLGKRVEIRDSPNLPIHPITARITTLIRSSPELATPERLNEIECTMHLHVNETSAADSRWEAKFGRRKKPKKEATEDVTFQRGDGLVRLADPESEFWTGGAEVEAYECR